MREDRVLAHLLLVAVVPLLAGCWSVAASATGGALLGVGTHAVSDTSQAVLSLSFGRTEILTRKTLAALAVDIVDVTRKKREGTDTKCHFEAGLSGEDVILVDVLIERLSSALTRVTVTASRGWLKPERETAEEILARIVKEGGEYSARKRFGPVP